MSEKIAQAILDGNGDYLLAVKGNQNRLEQAYDNIFVQSENVNTYSKH
jgi:hypothetical protein